MDFFDFEKKMSEYPIFTASEVKLIFENQKNILIQIAFWIKKGYLKRIKEGLYILTSAVRGMSPMIMAGKIYSPSYLSLEFALNYYGIIPDIPGTYTSVSSKSTKYFKTDFGHFSYQKIKSSFFTGYENRIEKNVSFSIATPEKALMDFLYLNKNKLSTDPDFWKEMRIDEDFKFQRKKLELYNDILNNKKVSRLLDSVMTYQRNAR